MAVTCVDGQGTEPHITGADKGRIHAGIFGEKSVVMAVGKRLEATQEGYNRITIAPGDASIHGRHVSVTAPEQVIITSGTQGQNRSDFICLKYERDSRGIESAKLVVLRGTPTTGEAKDPYVPFGNVLNGDAQDYFPIYRVKLNGIVTSKPEQLFIVANPLYKEDVISKIHVSQGWWETNYIRATRIGDRIFLNFHVKRIGGPRYDVKPWAEELLFNLDESIQPVSENVLFPAITDRPLYNSSGMRMIKVSPNGIKLMCSAEIDIVTGMWICAYCSWEIG